MGKTKSKYLKLDIGGVEYVQCLKCTLYLNKKKWEFDNSQGREHVCDPNMKIQHDKYGDKIIGQASLI